MKADAPVHWLTNDFRKKMLAIWLGLEGAGTPVLWRVVKFYFPD